MCNFVASVSLKSGMKKLFIILAIVASAYGLKAQEINGVKKPASELIVMKEASYDFGKIQQGKPVTHEFEVMNTAPDTLKLENVVASCGCTTPTWKKDPVAPGTGSKINVGYNAAMEGPFEKQITIFYNGGKTKTFAIKGNVYKGPATSAPQNTSIEILKQSSQ